MLTSLLIPKVVTSVNGVLTSTFSGILFDFFYRNYSSTTTTKRHEQVSWDSSRGARTSQAIERGVAKLHGQLRYQT